MTSAEIRQRFLDYFARHGHAVVPSSSLVPGSDPSLLFTNAGMVQFKDVFLGLEKRPYVRAVSCQRCVRAGGKHNDLENVGYTARHHTFFEMLGNFSFGDYFKREAIRFCWEFLTKEMNLPPERLWITIYKDDEEAADIWLKEIKVDPARFTRLGDDSNFWSMGDTGPCGPCSEIFYDHGPSIAGGPPGSPDEDGDRYVEIWNLVFMQYNRDAEARLTPLPSPSVDTGMGLERMSAVMHGVPSNYGIDLFRALTQAAGRILGVADPDDNALKVIADHIRASAFLIVDGIMPSNEGRGYVLRRIIRRAVRFGYQHGSREPFFHRMVAPLIEQMGEAYPELIKAQPMIEKALRVEEERFGETLHHGLQLLEVELKALGGRTIPGDLIFRLYDTYGFPTDLTRDVAYERGLTLDLAGFEHAMNEQRTRARAASGFRSTGLAEVAWGSTFVGYDLLRCEARVLGIRVDDTDVESLPPGTEGVVWLDRTPFYAESGGQAGDVGVLRTNGTEFRVANTHKGWAHAGRVERGTLKVGDPVQAEVDPGQRQQSAWNHSATHLLHAALKRVLGEHVQQKGSLVTPSRLRFDFSHFEPIPPAQLREIERLVNEEIRRNAAVETHIMPVEEAMKSGACALFGEKYDAEVRVVGMGTFSRELCGGTHVTRVGDIGLFRIVSEGGVAAGVRRIEAVTGRVALASVHETDDTLRHIAELVRGQPQDAVRKIEQLREKMRTLEKEIEGLRQKLASGQGQDLAAQARDIGGIRVLAARLDGVDGKALREALDQLKEKLAPAAIVLAAVEGSKVTLIAGATKEVSGRVPAGELVNVVAKQVGGKGGGRPDMAQAGGNDPSGLDAALASVPAWVEQRL